MRGGIGVSPRKNKLKHKKSWREKGVLKMRENSKRREEQRGLKRKD
jgi:hypothetical protein